MRPPGVLPLGSAGCQDAVRRREILKRTRNEEAGGRRGRGDRHDERMRQCQERGGFPRGPAIGPGRLLRRQPPPPRAPGIFPAGLRSGRAGLRPAVLKRRARGAAAPSAAAPATTRGASGPRCGPAARRRPQPPPCRLTPRAVMLRPAPAFQSDRTPAASLSRPPSILPPPAPRPRLYHLGCRRVCGAAQHPAAARAPLARRRRGRVGWGGAPCQAPASPRP